MSVCRPAGAAAALVGDATGRNLTRGAFDAAFDYRCPPLLAASEPRPYK